MHTCISAMYKIRVFRKKCNNIFTTSQQYWYRRWDFYSILRWPIAQKGFIHNESPWQLTNHTNFLTLPVSYIVHYTHDVLLCASFVTYSASAFMTVGVVYYKVKVNLSRNKSRILRGRTWCSASILALTFGTTKMAELSALCTSRALPPRKFLGTNFC